MNPAFSAGMNVNGCECGSKRQWVWDQKRRRCRRSTLPFAGDTLTIRFLRGKAENLFVLFGLTHAVMTDVGATYPEDHVFGDVGGVIGHAFEVARHDQSVKRLPR